MTGGAEWKPITSAPFQTVVEVRNELMDEPVLATRGHVFNGMVCANLNLFSTLSGHLVCPTEWREPERVSA